MCMMDNKTVKIHEKFYYDKQFTRALEKATKIQKKQLTY